MNATAVRVIRGGAFSKKNMRMLDESGHAVHAAPEICDFVNEFGCRFGNPVSLPKGMRKRKDGACFKNAGENLFRFEGEYDYCEGRVGPDDGILHGWLFRLSDSATIDPTFGANVMEYVGFRIPLKLVAAQMCKVGSWGLFGNLPKTDYASVFDEIRKYNHR